MSEPKFTPGPWKIAVEDIGDEDFIVVPTHIIGPNGERVVGSEGGLYTWDARSMDTVKADANLIAAAPDLYAALNEMMVDADAHAERITRIFGEDIITPESREMFVRAKAALAKARGGEAR